LTGRQSSSWPLLLLAEKLTPGTTRQLMIILMTDESFGLKEEYDLKTRQDELSG